MNLNDYVKDKVIRTLNGQVELPENPNTTAEKFVYVNDIERAQRMRLLEYRTWYKGDGDEIRMFYTRGETFEFYYEPFFDKNKRNYFWSVSSTEQDYKCTHSGLPHIIVDTLTNMIDYPEVRSGYGIPSIDEKIQMIEKSNDLPNLFKKIAIPDVMVTGWGDLKIDWNTRWSKYPIIKYYKAEDVDYIYIFGNKHIGTIYKDFYYKNARAYVLVETRYIAPSKHGASEDGPEFDLHIEKELFELDNASELKQLSENEVERLFPNLLNSIKNNIIITNCDKLFSTQVILFPETDGTGYGRSIYTGKVSLFDDLDQCLSQAANTVRRSTPITVINTEYLERDKNGLPIVPKSFDRKYVRFKSGKDTMGTINATEPISISQPQLNYESFTAQALDITEHILQGTMAPATLGIEISRKDNADAQREKEKVTVFTRNAILKSLTVILKDLYEQSLMICEYIENVLSKSESPKINNHKYNISIDFEEFADASYENKLQVLGNAYASKLLSPELFINKLYKKNMSEELKNQEIAFLNKQIAYEHPEENPDNAGNAQDMMAMLGGGGGGGMMPPGNP